MMYISIVIFGLIIGSFIGALTYRFPRNIGIKHGRSFCPKCRSKIAWYDNIPLLSYFILRGRCRNCKKKISARYVLIEFFTAFCFLLLFFVFQNCANYPAYFCFWNKALAYFALPYLFLFISGLIAIFIIDFEHQIIPDEIVFFELLLVITGYFLTGNPLFYTNLFAGFAGSLFLLLVNLVTRGKGMGLGDVKLTIPLGFMLGAKLMVVWLSGAFFLGSLIGIFLILLKKAKFGKTLAFGPFLIISFLIVLIYGNEIAALLFPF